MGELIRYSLFAVIAYAMGLAGTIPAGRWAIRRGEVLAPKAATAFRCSFIASLLSAYAPISVAVIIGFARPHLCIADPQDVHLSRVCDVVAIAMLMHLLLGLALIFVSYWYWPPWRRSWKMQLLRVWQLVFWILPPSMLGLVCDA